MAKVYIRKNDLKMQVKFYELQSKIGIGMTVGGAVLWFFNICVLHIMNGVFLFIMLMIIGGGVFYSSFMRKKYDILKAGFSGEESTRKSIESLPDDYYAITNIKISYDGKQSELDMVVVGETGVFIIETKNHTGLIRGDAEASQFVQKKVGRGGTPYSKEMYNPIKQVSTHTYRLANFLKNRGVQVWVQGIVYFSNFDAELRISNISEKIPVFSRAENGEENMRNYITEYPAKKKLSREDVAKIVKILK